MTNAQKYSITMKPIGTNIGDVKIEVMAEHPAQAIEKAIDVARQKYPELTSTTFNYFEIKLIP